ncbi:MAG: hypothetical protein ACOC1F_03910 [Myxococcota bacterium]
MVRFQEFRREQLLASDGSIGSVYDLYFEDGLWQIRYFVVDTRRWLPGRKVLIAPEAVIGDQPWSEGVPVNLTREQVKHSPGFKTELPVSRKNEEALVAYYQWAQRFTRTVAPAFAAALPHQPVEVINPREAAEPQLRSAREVLGYDVVGPDGAIGDIVDLRFDKVSFTIQALEVDPHSQVGLPVLTIHPRHVLAVRWNDRTVVVDVDFGNLAGVDDADRGLAAPG